MKTLRIFLMAAVALGLFATSLNAAPLVGLYESIELGGDVVDGRWSEAWVGGVEGAIGSIVNAASWDGTTLGTMWELRGSAISATPVLRHSGLTFQNWYTTYSGGSLILKDTGPWWGGGAGTEYALTITSHTHDTTKYFRSDGALHDVTTLVNIAATFDAFPAYSVDFIIAVAGPVGFGASPEADYPAFAINTTAGAWGFADKITMTIIPEPATLAILGLGGLLLRRRIA